MSNGALVPLSSVVTMSEQAELQPINHADRERAITITGNVAPGHAQGEALAYVQSLAASAPVGYRVVLGGQSSQFGDAMSSLVFALLIGILVAYMVLASQFNSFLHPVTVLTILPLSVAGAMFALFLADKTLNIFSMIGLLLLMGIVKKNSIILVDYANEVRARGNLDAADCDARGGPGASPADPDDRRRDADGGGSLGAWDSGLDPRREVRWPTRSSAGSCSRQP